LNKTKKSDLNGPTAKGPEGGETSPLNGERTPTCKRKKDKEGAPSSYHSRTTEMPTSDIILEGKEGETEARRQRVEKKHRPHDDT